MVIVMVIYTYKYMVNDYVAWSFVVWFLHAGFSKLMQASHSFMNLTRKL